MVLLYTVSTLYHALGVNRAKVVFRSLDHCTIFLLIAGTYTPITLVCLGGWKGWAMFGVVWACLLYTSPPWPSWGKPARGNPPW